MGEVGPQPAGNCGSVCQRCDQVFRSLHHLHNPTTTSLSVSGLVFHMDRLDAPPLALLPGNKLVPSSLLVTDEWGTYPFDAAMQNTSEEVCRQAVRNVPT